MARDNRRRTTQKRRPKKRKINKKKIIVLAVMIFAFVFALTKITQTTTTLVKNFSAIVKGSQDKESEEAEKSSEQFDLSSEAKKIDKKFTILVDPGHGGNDVGTISSNKAKESYEKDITLQIGKNIASRLSKYNDIQVMITRTEDKYVGLAERVQMANGQNVDLTVSIHLNGESGGNTANGLETYYRKGATDTSKELAQAVQSSIVSYIGVRDRGIREENFEVLKTTAMPTILVECGFLTNPEEEKKLKDSAYQDQMSEAIVQGVLSYLDNKK
ncbi:N-acetylmuramoyl-L-alanine amidase [Romboutsia weinsteinii]|uniref:N-acetylmuramoyl-L-alanine amidase n=1 Tax=Romboutsia weinsteinii TaxID=2020949 RepID=A0A371J3Y3_9FIRM|nr:N-acetylmuramoyl-L-alanine amidase [Romboutsia weinsteinii]RDY27384.1 N-acetylmuramoyl-L-alanine amidase [Romboutsia weinsteinii]